MKLVGRLPKTKRVLIVTFGLMIAAVAGLFIYAETSSSRYVERSDAAYSEAEQLIYRLLSSDKLSVRDLDDIKSVAERAAVSLCDPPAIAKWRVEASYQAKCTVREQQLEAVGRASDKLASHLEAEGAVADTLNQLSDDLESIKASDYRARQDLWEATYKRLDELPEVETYQAVLETQRAAIKQIIDRYQKLIAADKSQKRDQFDEAAASLEAAYDDFLQTKADAKEIYVDQADDLVEAVEIMMAPEVQMN